MTAFETVQRVTQGDRVVHVVEGEDLFSPPGTGKPFRFFGQQPGPACDDQDVMADLRTVFEVDRVRLDVHAFDFTCEEPYAVVKLVRTGADYVPGFGHAEGQEEQAGLIDVVTLAVDHGDLGIVAVLPVETVRRQGTAGSGSDDRDALAHCLPIP